MSRKLTREDWLDHGLRELGRGGAGRLKADPLARALGDRHRGAGFDQLAEIGPGGDGADASLTFRNPDGGLAGACGNATRCVADLLMRERRTDALTLRTERGTLRARRRPDGVVEVNMGPPRLDWRDIPLARAADTAWLPLEGAPGAVSMGNPHAVFFVAEAEAVDLAALGPRWEHDAMFPERANIGFAQIVAPDRLRLRVWERGTGVTLACGSGACAAAAAAARRGLIGRGAQVVMDGGVLEVDWRDDGVRLAGPVAYVYEAELAAEFAALATAEDAA